MKKLEELGFIILQKQIYVKCAYRFDDDYKNLTEDQTNCTGIGIVQDDEERTICNECDRIIMIRNKKTFLSYIVKLMCSNLRLHLIEKIHRYLEPETSDNSHIILRTNDKIHKICFLDLCQDIECKTSFYYSDEILYTYCDYTEKIDAENVVWIIDLLSMDDDKILSFILSKTPSIVIENIEQIMNDHIDKIDEYQFEEFIKRLNNYIAFHPKEYNKGKSFLKKYSGSIVASFTFKIGGAGKVDGRIVNLKEYFKIASKSNTFFEAKHSDINNYKITSLTYNDIEQLIHHSFEQSGVLYSNREKIAGYFVDDLYRYKEKFGFWKYIVIHRPLLKLYISLFAPEFWNDPNCLNNP